MHTNAKMKMIVQFFRNITKTSKIVWIFLAFIALVLYLVTPPAGVEYNISGYLTIRNFRHGYRKTG